MNRVTGLLHTVDVGCPINKYRRGTSNETFLFSLIVLLFMMIIDDFHY